MAAKMNVNKGFSGKVSFKGSGRSASYRAGARASLKSGSTVGQAHKAGLKAQRGAASGRGGSSGGAG